MKPVKKMSKTAQQRKILFEEFHTGVTLHGFRFLFKGENFVRKLMWFVVSTAMFFLSAFLCYNMVYDYLNYKTSTSVTKVYSNNRVIFPTITVCPFNSYSAKKMAKNNLTNILKHITGPNNGFLNFTDETLTELRNMGSLKELHQMMELSYHDMVQPYEVLKHFSNPTCLFYQSACQPREFKSVYSWELSQCIQFNSYNSSRETLVVNSSVYMNGLYLFLNIHQNETYNPVFPFEGIGITVDAYGSPHQMSISRNSLLLRPGSFYMIKLAMKQTIILPEPYESKCGAKPYKLVTGDYPYSRSLCLVDCIMSFVYDACGCVGFEVEEYVDGIEICGIDKLQCYTAVQKDSIESEKHEICLSKCPLKCEKTHYDITHTSVNIGNRKIYQHLLAMPGWNKTPEETVSYVQDNIVGIHISFDDLSVAIERTTPAVTWITLLSSIGGSMGLCLGFSFITGFEFVVFIFDYMLAPLTSFRHHQIKDFIQQDVTLKDKRTV